jgi:glutamyl-tRNA reductase
MSTVVAVSVNHRTVPLRTLERMTVPPTMLSKVLDDLHRRDHLSEVVVLSTCNRTEVYAVAETFHGAIDDINHFFAALSGIDTTQFVDHLITAYDEGAASHLFAVASGLRSAVVGEHEILGQVRIALDAAREARTLGPRLDALFRHALETGKRARTETAISRGTASVSQAAVELAEARVGSLVGRSVLVLGAGDIGVAMATSLHHHGVGSLLVANRTRAKAAGVAAKVHGTTVALHELPAALEGVDVLLTATSSASVVLDADDIAAVMAARAGRPLVIVDTGLPRDVDPAAANVPGITLLDMDAIRAFAELGVESRRHEIDRVTEIIVDEVDRFVALEMARQVSPVVTSLRTHLESVRAEMVDRYDARLADLTPEQREMVEALTKQLVSKIAHQPTMALKEAAGSPKGRRLTDSARELFDLSAE